MKTPTETFETIKKKIKKEWKVAFFTVLILGFLIHFPVISRDIPNHDGLDSIYFDQNMITSGRWFLTIACGLSSYYTLPWLIGLLGLVFLGVTGALLAELWEVRETVQVIALSSLLVSFPALASTCAYIFTMDGYMLGLMLAVLAVYLTGKSRYGFCLGAVCLAFSMGTYQAYLSFAAVLAIFVIGKAWMAAGSIRKKLVYALRYLSMGILGGVLYYLILKLLLFIQGKQLADYQGINGMEGNGAHIGIVATLSNIYRDFAAFTLKGSVLLGNPYAAIATAVLLFAAAFVFVRLVWHNGWWKQPLFYGVLLLLALGLPIATNLILIVSPGVTYHLLMRYQWVLYPMVLLALCANSGAAAARTGVNSESAAEQSDAGVKSSNAVILVQWLAVTACLVLTFVYGVTDNVAYSNLAKKYEKTYAYCVRLLDRIEQTPGYYPGIPIAMVGVVGDEQFPETDITGDVTDAMIGFEGDGLLYTSANYEAFMKHYLGATLNFLTPDEVAPIYYSEEYIAMESFPGASSTQVVDGILYVKTENVNR